MPDGVSGPSRRRAATVPGMVQDVQVERVLVGVDPSTGAEVALQWAIGLARRCDADVVLVHARGLLDGGDGSHGGGLDGPDGDLPGWLAELIDAIDPDVSLSLSLVHGPPPEALLRVAAEEVADLVVVGRRGAGSPFELTMGSTSREVSSRSEVPVLVVPAG